mmetsp:Transcript_26993/g.38621  ORF Transcript_26993/g.38621 Transcript_26993/m.38621 type:complete len:142 (+) Transcript_26993:465-890(+)
MRDHHALSRSLNIDNSINIIINPSITPACFTLKLKPKHKTTIKPLHHRIHYSPYRVTVDSSSLERERKVVGYPHLTECVVANIFVGVSANILQCQKSENSSEERWFAEFRLHGVMSHKCDKYQTIKKSTKTAQRNLALLWL